MRKSIGNSIIAVLVIVFISFIILYPKEIMVSARDGISLWFNIVFPSLFPFFIGTELLRSLGVVHFLGTLLEPVMRPLFRVPGVGAFAYAMGVTSGYPIGAKITKDLRMDNAITKEEAQRLISFSNNSGPLFMLGSVGVGIFQSAAFGYYLILSHLLSSLLTGLIFRFYKSSASGTPAIQGNLFKKACKNMNAKQSGKKIGALLGDAVSNAMETIVQVGGFIILFSVLVSVLQLSGIMGFITGLLATALASFQLPESALEGLFIGIIEITNGAKLLSAPEIAVNTAFPVTCGIIAWGGLSIHAQTISIIHQTDIHVPTYLLAKCIQGILACMIGGILYLNHAGKFTAASVEVFMPSVTNYVLPYSALLCSLCIFAVIAGVWFKKINAGNHIHRKKKI